MYQNTVALPRLDLAQAVRTQDRLGTAIAHRLLPIFKVSKRAATMPSLLQTNAQILAVKHAPKTAYQRVQATLSDKQYFCEEAGIEVPLSAEDYDVLGQDECERIATVQGDDILLTARDNAIISQVTGAAGETLLAGQITTPVENWSEALGTPIDDIAAADSALTLRFGAGPRHLFLGQAELEALQTNVQVRTEYRRVVGQTDAGATNRRMKLEALADILGVDEIIVSDRRYDSATKGQTTVWSYLWPARYCLLTRGVLNPNELTEPAFGRTFLWDGANAGAEGEMLGLDPETGIAVESYRDEPKKTDVIRSTEYTDLKILNLQAAQMIKLPADD